MTVHHVYRCYENNNLMTKFNKLQARARNINSICGCGWYITIKVWKIDNVKIEVVSFLIKSGRKLTIGVKFEVNVMKWGQGSCYCSFLIISRSSLQFVCRFVYVLNHGFFYRIVSSDLSKSFSENINTLLKSIL
jgi:hypothetical protein